MKASHAAAFQVLIKVGAEAYADILARLPNSFFSLSDAEQAGLWVCIWTAIEAGVTEPDKLTAAAVIEMQRSS